MNNTIFDAYYKRLIKDAKADLPHEKLAVLQQMRAALHSDGSGNGVIPIALGVNGPELARFNVTHPVYAALLKGEVMAIQADGELHAVASRCAKSLPRCVMKMKKRK